MSHLELTLAILKPHVLSNPIAHNYIKKLILDSNFKIVQSKVHKLCLSEVESFYAEHKKKFFYNRLITFMTSGKSHICVLAKENAIQDWRKLMGPTKVYKTQFTDPNSLRGLFGLSDTRNVTHGSDSVESARREINVLFPNFDIDKWYLDEEKLFRNNHVQLLLTDFLHVPINKI